MARLGENILAQSRKGAKKSGFAAWRLGARQESGFSGHDKGQVDWTSDAPGNKTWFTYDAVTGRRTEVKDALEQVTTTEYDLRGNVTHTETQPAGGVTLTRTYDTKGRSGGFFLGAAATPDYEVAYGYDAANGRFASVTNGRDANAKVFQYGYLPGSDLIATVTHPNGVVATKAYETQRDLVDYVENKLGETVISKYDYANDAIGRRTGRADSGTVFSQPSVANVFGYDIRSQVTGAVMGVNKYGYHYDPIGNRDSYTNNQAVTTYTANPLNQYTAISGQPAPTYDDDGNMLGQGGWTYQWDAENRLIEAVETPVQTGSKKLSFAYDHMSRRYSKKVYVYTAASEYELQSSNVFVYDSWNMIRELDAMNANAVIRSQVWGLDLSGTLQGAGGVGGLLSSSLQSPASSLSCCYDANGNATEYVASDGTVAAHYEYDPFGNTTASSGVSAGVLPYRFSSKYLDGETGLLYYGYRYLLPPLGQWLGRDRLSESGGLHLCAFALNTACNQIDTLGLTSMWDPTPSYPPEDWEEPWKIVREQTAIVGTLTHATMVVRVGYTDYNSGDDGYSCKCYRQYVCDKYAYLADIESYSELRKRRVRKYTYDRMLPSTASECFGGPGQMVIGGTIPGISFPGWGGCVALWGAAEWIDRAVTASIWRQYIEYSLTSGQRVAPGSTRWETTASNFDCGEPILVSDSPCSNEGTVTIPHLEMPGNTHLPFVIEEEIGTPFRKTWSILEDFGPWGY